MEHVLLQSFEAELNNILRGATGGESLVTFGEASFSPYTFGPDSLLSEESRHMPEQPPIPGAYAADDHASISKAVIKDRVTIEVTQGDITEERTDAIVNSTNNILHLGMWFDPVFFSHCIIFAQSFKGRL